MITIAEGMDLPDELVTEVTGILARRSAGKTYTAKKIAEQVIKLRLPVVIIDPLGAFWGLRSSVDGLSDGLPVVIFGGAHGDMGLTPDVGKVIAEVIVDNPGAYIVDLSHFDTKGEEITFMTAFLERLYRYKAQHPSALLLIIDEADTFAPQKPETREIKMLGSMESIVRRGRLRGIGVILITQRAAVLNKNCLTQVELLILLQTTSPQDRKAVLAWIEAKSAEDEQKEVMSTIGGLSVGEAWLWSPAWLKILQRVRILPAETFDSSKTPKPGEAIIEPEKWAKVDLEALGAKVEAARVRAQAEDVPLLQREIARLKSMVAELQEEQEEVREVRVVDPVAILAAGDIERLEEALKDLRATSFSLSDERQALDHGIHTIDGIAEGIGAALEQWAPGRVAPNVATFGASMASDNQFREGERQLRKEIVAVARVEPAAGPRLGRFPSSNLQDDDYEPVAFSHNEPEPIARVTRVTDTPAGLEIEAERVLGKPDRAFLTAIAQFPDGRSKRQAAMLAGYRVGVSTTKNALGRLRSRGLITGTGNPGDPLLVTPVGMAALGDVELPPTGRDLIGWWMGRIGKPDRAFVQAILDAHPRALNKVEAAAAAGYDPGVSTTKNALGRLRTYGLIVGTNDNLMINPDLGL